MEVIRSLKEKIERELKPEPLTANRKERRAAEAFERRDRRKQKRKVRVRQLEDQEV